MHARCIGGNYMPDSPEPSEIRTEYKEWNDQLQRNIRLAAVLARAKGMDVYAVIDLASKVAVSIGVTTHKILKEWVNELD
jgi:hypothetical protein